MAIVIDKKTGNILATDYQGTKGNAISDYEKGKSLGEYGQFYGLAANADGYPDKWLNEAAITPSSQPHVQIELMSNMGQTREPIPYTLVQSMTVEGKSPVSRSGDIKLVDPEGRLPDILARLGAETNSKRNAMYPNIRIVFGWRGLRTGALTAELDGLITKTAFDITDDGVTTCDIHFIETAIEVLQRLRFWDPNDMKYIFTFDNARNLNIGERLKWLFTDPDAKQNLSIWTKFLAQKGITPIRFVFDPTDDKPTGDKWEVNWGDFLLEIINEMSAKAVKDKKPDEKAEYSYERLSVLKKSDNDGQYTEMHYGWRKSADEDNDQPNHLIEYMEVGPTLVWKKQTTPATQKQIIGWSSDLNSKTYLIHQGQDALTEKLSKFEEKDISEINSRMRSGGANALKKEGPNWFTGSLSQDSQRRNSLKETIDDTNKATTKETVENQNSQLMAILNNNVFKATCTIMGDPTMGTRWAPWFIRFKTDFSAVGNFAAVFGARDWALTNVRHIFEEGKFTTEMELMSYPPISTSQSAASGELSGR